MPQEKRTKITTAVIIPIVVAVIGLIGVLGAALFGNWDKIFEPTNHVSDAPATISTLQPNDIKEVLAAPALEAPKCNSARKWPPDNHFLPVYWHPVEHAASYAIEIDCRSAKDDPTAWRGSDNHPWFVKRGVAYRMMSNPIYSSKVHLKMKEVGCSAMRWRVWAIDHEGIDGNKSEWCQVSFF